MEKIKATKIKELNKKNMCNIKGGDREGGNTLCVGTSETCNFGTQETGCGDTKYITSYDGIWSDQASTSYTEYHYCV